LGEAFRSWSNNLDSNVSGDDDDSDEANDKHSGPDGNGEGGSDLDVNHDDNEDNGAPGPVDGPPILSEVVLAQRRGTQPLSMSYTGVLTDFLI